MMRKIGNWLVVAAFSVMATLFVQDDWLAKYRPKFPSHQFINQISVHASPTATREVFVSQHDLHVRWGIAAVVVALFAAGAILKASSGEE